jgi:ribosomal protein S18 acetylase RimI-like enzyme
MTGRAQPAVRLRPMAEAEFPAWRELAIEHHAGQVSRASGKEIESAIDESRELLAKVLPAGLATPAMQLFVVMSDPDREVGWLWLGQSPQDPGRGFVFDILIDPDVRGEGYGRVAMHAAEQVFREQGKSSIGLDVAGGNDIARALYESLGYRPIITSMAKTLDLSR